MCVTDFVSVNVTHKYSLWGDLLHLGGKGEYFGADK